MISKYYISQFAKMFSTFIHQNEFPKIPERIPDEKIIKYDWAYPPFGFDCELTFPIFDLFTGKYVNEIVSIIRRIG